MGRVRRGGDGRVRRLRSALVEPARVCQVATGGPTRDAVAAVVRPPARGGGTAPDPGGPEGNRKRHSREEGRTEGRAPARILGTDRPVQAVGPRRGAAGL